MMQGELCKKCGTFYEDPEKGFYWEARKGHWRKPCKQCISEYNKKPSQRKKRIERQKKYLQTEKGREAQKRGRANQEKKKYLERKKNAE